MLDISLTQEAGVPGSINRAQGLPNRCTREAWNVHDNNENSLVPVAMSVACHHIRSAVLKADERRVKARKYVQILSRLFEKEVKLVTCWSTQWQKKGTRNRLVRIHSTAICKHVVA